MNPKVSIIILNWNGWQDTLECLESLYQIKYDNYKVIVVDNASDDDSLEKIKDYCQGEVEVSSHLVKYQKDNKPLKFFEIDGDEADKENIDVPDSDLFIIKNSKNQGFAKGNNTGIKFTYINFEPDYFLLLNNDTVVDPEFLGELVRTAEPIRCIGFAGPKTYLYNDINRIQAAGGGNIDLFRGESHEVGFMMEDTGEFDEDLELDYVGGSCILVKREIIDRIDFLYELYYMYWEDVDWCFAAREDGYISYYSHKSKIWHKYGTSSQNYFKTYYHNRNRLLFMRRHAPKYYYQKFLRHYLKEIITESGYQLIYKRNLKLFNAIIKGAIDGFRQELC